MAQEINESYQEVEGTGPAEAVALTIKEVQTLLGATNDSLEAMCRRVEEAETRDDVKAALRQLNRMMKIFMDMVADVTYDHLIRQAICDMGVTQRFQELLISAASFREALTEYKTAVVLILAQHCRRLRTSLTWMTSWTMTCSHISYRGPRCLRTMMSRS